MPPHPPFIALPDPDATLLAQTRARYEAGEITSAEAAKTLGFSRTTLTHRITHKWFWRVPQRLAASKARRSLAEAAKIKAPSRPRAVKKNKSPKANSRPRRCIGASWRRSRGSCVRLRPMWTKAACPKTPSATPR